MHFRTKVNVKVSIYCQMYTPIKATYQYISKLKTTNRASIRLHGQWKFEITSNLQQSSILTEFN